MKIILLRDREDKTVDGVIIAEITTKEDIEAIINQIRDDVAEGREDNDYFALLTQRLPADCKIADKWSNKWEEVWY